MTQPGNFATDRRKVLAGIGAGISAVVAGGVNLSLAAGPGDKRFVLVILRGGMDGLALIPPHGDDAYRDIRGALAMSSPDDDGGMIGLDGFFGLHPSAGALLPFWQRRELLVFPATATPYRGRSHFEAQDTLENGTASPDGAKTGWLNRAMELFGNDAGPAVTLSQRLPLVLAGPHESSAWPASRLPEQVTGFFEKMALLYLDDAIFAPLLAEGLRQRESMARRLGEEDRQSGRGAGRPQDLETLAVMAAKSLRSPGGARIAVLETGGWDTHQKQGALQGVLARKFAGLAGALSAMAVELGAAWPDTVVAVVSEFGRSAGPNGTRGTDHGTAGTMLLLGGEVAGGRIAGEWPGLAGDGLFDGVDLAPVTDVRSVFETVLVEHMGLPATGVRNTVFPGATAEPMSGLMRSQVE